jgi:hypothetical protein
MDPLLQQEITEAGLRLRKAIARVVSEAPECIGQRTGKWSFQFSNPASGESIFVTYVGPNIEGEPN